jgi:hypothetical protein
MQKVTPALGSAKGQFTNRTNEQTRTEGWSGKKSIPKNPHHFTAVKRNEDILWTRRAPEEEHS